MDAWRQIAWNAAPQQWQQCATDSSIPRGSQCARHAKRTHLLIRILEHLDRHDRAGGAVPTPCHHAICAFANGAEILVLLRASLKAFLTFARVQRNTTSQAAYARIPPSPATCCIETDSIGMASETAHAACCIGICTDDVVIIHLRSRTSIGTLGGCARARRRSGLLGLAGQNGRG
jgi:hypothetical protein